MAKDEIEPLTNLWPISINMDVSRTSDRPSLVSMVIVRDRRIASKSLYLFKYEIDAISNIMIIVRSIERGEVRVDRDTISSMEEVEFVT